MPRKLRLFANAAIAIFALGIVWVVGHRGLFLLDQSAVFDGAWRVLQGEAPYKDFLMPFGPVTFWIQAAFFRLAGVNFSSMVLSAAVINALAALASMRIVRILIPDAVIPPLAAGILTAVWFQTPFGTLWFEQVGFFFDFIALLLVLEAGAARNRRILALRPRDPLPDGRGSETALPSRARQQAVRNLAVKALALNSLAGAAAATAFLSKQNAGGFFFFLLIGVTCLCYRTELRKLLSVLAGQAAGFAAVGGVFAVWLWAKSDPRQFLHYFFEIALRIAADRTPGFAKPLWAMLRMQHTLVLPWVYYVVMAIGVISFVRGCFQRALQRQTRDLYLTVGFILCGGVLFQDAFIAVTMNEPQNAQPFLGLVIGLCFGLLAIWLGEIPWLGPARWALLALVTASLFFACLSEGLWADRERVVHGFGGTRFIGPLHVRGAERLLWGEPTELSATASISKSDFEGLNAWIDSHPGPFFIFPDTTILYGLHGRRAPQPWLYFCEGHSFLPEELNLVDGKVRESLDRSGIQTVILENASWMGNHRLLERMPLLRAWIEAEFVKETRFAIYDVWTRKR